MLRKPFHRHLCLPFLCLILSCNAVDVSRKAEISPNQRNAKEIEEPIRSRSDLVKASSPPMLALQDEKVTEKEEELSWNFLERRRENWEKERKERRDCKLKKRSRRQQKVVGFSLVRAGTDSLRGDAGKIRFENVFTDLNGDWNPRNSVFMCKEPGLYFFTFNARGQGMDMDEDAPYEDVEPGWMVTLMLNGVEVVAIGGKSQEPSTASNSILLALNPRDEVWLELSRGRLVESTSKSSHAGAATFSGYRVGAIERDDIGDDDEEDDDDDDIEIAGLVDDDDSVDFEAETEKPQIPEEDDTDPLMYENRIRDRYHNWHKNRWWDRDGVNFGGSSSSSRGRGHHYWASTQSSRRPLRRRYGQWYPSKDEDKVQVYYYKNSGGSPSFGERRRPIYSTWKRSEDEESKDEKDERERGPFQFVSLRETARRQS